MKKRISMYLAIVFAIMPLLTIMNSCSSPKSGADLIPEDAFYVMSYDMQSFIKKSGIDQNTALLRAMKNGLRHDDISKKAQQMLMKLVTEPESVGIDASQPVYCGIIPTRRDVRVLITGSIESKELYGKLLDELLEEDYELEEENGISGVFDEDSGTIFLYNDDYFLIANSDRQEEDPDTASTGFYRYFGLKNSFSGTEICKQMNQKSGIVRIAVNGEEFMKLPAIRSAMEDMVMDFSSLYEDSYIIGGIDSRKGALTAEVETILPSESGKQYLDVMNRINSRISGDFAEYISQNSFTYLAMGLAGEEIAKVFDEYIPEMMKSAMGKEMEEMMNLLGTFNGDVALNVSGFDMVNKMPEMSILARTDNSKALDYGAEMSGLKKEGDCWIYPMETYRYADNAFGYEKVQFGKIMLGFEDHTSFAYMAQEPRILEKPEKAIDRKAMSGKFFYAYFNMDRMMNSPIWGDGTDDETVEAILDETRDITLEVPEIGKFILNMNFKDSDTEALQVIMDVLTENL